MTLIGAVAEPYATALYELADEEKALDVVADDLVRLRAMIGESADFARMIRSPLMRRQDQMAAMAALMTAAGMSDTTRRFVGLVAANRRLFALESMIGAYLRRLAEARGEVTAEVVSAAALSDAQVATVTEALRRSVGGKVAVDLRVDPRLIGGLIVRIGSRLVDSSLRTKLQKLQLVMKGIG